ncbi:Spliceosome-associated protein 49 [Pleurostoma richardsiae]|uniref:Spliceosome-associated protein 49 n=1 Tax=Pleurostoma richardsiae TaxID=41990 RepID=A0AA38RQY4_9PEZI|nr:Spliceosome-associated protein 49 [Pleurostoma richardsiae]
MANRHWEQNKDATVYVGNLDERVTEANLWELMIQMGPVYNVHMPMDRVSRTHQGYGFVEFDTPESADYAARVLNGIRLHQKPIRVNKASADKQKAQDIGAELFVNNLDQQVDEKILFDTFSRFGTLVAPPTVVRDQNNISKGYGFVSFGSFEDSDRARDTMNGEYLLSKQITVEYAYKKDGKGERHGDEAERKLAAEGKKHNVVVEQQPLPPALLMSAPPPAPSGANGIPVAGYGADLGAPPTVGAAPIVPPPALPAGFAPPPVAAAAPGPGMVPPAGFGRASNLPPAPSGLPARPPASSMPYGAPVGVPGAPGFHAVPPPVMPPPGFGTPTPPPGFATPGRGAVPSPFVPPPAGFNVPPPAGQAPPGFRR